MAFASKMVLIAAMLVFGISSGSIAQTGGLIHWIEKEDLIQRVESAQKEISFFHLVDLRLEADYRKKHISTAINIPYSKLRFVAEKIFAKSDFIVLYGYSDHEPLGVNAAIFLKNKKFESPRVLRGGIKEWTGPTEMGLIQT